MLEDYELPKYFSNVLVWVKLLIVVGCCFPITMVIGYLLAIFFVMKSGFVCYAMERDVRMRSKVLNE